MGSIVLHVALTLLLAQGCCFTLPATSEMSPPNGPLVANVSEDQPEWRIQHEQQRHLQERHEWHGQQDAQYKGHN